MLIGAAHAMNNGNGNVMWHGANSSPDVWSRSETLTCDLDA
jgi:hypothetical protein